MSGASVSDVNDRLAALELRVQQQEDELTVMKAALADVLRRLDASETSAAATKKQHGGKSKQSAQKVNLLHQLRWAVMKSEQFLWCASSLGGAALREAHSLSCITNGGTSARKRESTSVTRKETLSSAAKR